MHRYSIRRSRHILLLFIAGLAVPGCGSEHLEVDRGEATSDDATLLPELDDESLSHDAGLRAHGTAADEGEVAAQNHSEFNSPDVVELAWVAAPRGLKLPAVAGNGTTALLVRNTTAQQMTVELSAVADDGTIHSVEKALDTVALPAGTAEEVPVNLHELGLNVAAMQYSGQVQVIARVSLADSANARQVIGQPLYFHPTGNQELTIYPEGLLRTRFNAGNFRSAKDPALAPPIALPDADEELFVERVISGANLDFEDPVDDDVVVPEPEDEQAQAQAQAHALQAPPDSQLTSLYPVCIRFQVQTTDSGYLNNADIGEDLWFPANDGVVSPAFGGRVQYKTGTYWTTKDLDQSGCAILGNTASVTDIIVYAFGKNTTGSEFRLHTGSGTSIGATYSIYVDNAVLDPNTTTFISVGSYTSRWTAAGAMATALWRYNSAPAVQYYVAETTPSTPDPCASRNHDNDFVNNVSLIDLAGPSCFENAMRSKFIVAHEFGHGIGAQFANDSFPSNYTHNVPYSACPMGALGHSLDSKEWSSAAAIEGWAHFVAAKVWNNRAADGLWVYEGFVGSLERMDRDDTPRGWLRNYCCTTSDCATSLNGAGVGTDWMRAFWDIYTSNACTPSYTQIDMLQFYKNILVSNGLTDSNFYPASQDAIQRLVNDGHVGSCFTSEWTYFGCHNGINFQGTLPTGTCLGFGF